MRTVLCHGVFDVLHIGHIRLLKCARDLGDELVVSLLADKYVRLYKGSDRPIHTLDMRIEQVAELRCVDRVVVVDGPGHEAVQEMIDRVAPAYYVKGAECIGKLPEYDFLRARAIPVVFMDMIRNGTETSSSSKLVREFSD